MRHGSVSFSGKSGEAFHFQVWPLGTQFKAIGAVYFVTRRAFDNSTYRRACHDGIYIGHAENLADAFTAHVHSERFKKFGANCVCVLPLDDEQRRIAVEQDLLDMHSTHCNHEARAARIFSAPPLNSQPVY